MTHQQYIDLSASIYSQIINMTAVYWYDGQWRNDRSNTSTWSYYETILYGTQWLPRLTQLTNLYYPTAGLLSDTLTISNKNNVVVNGRGATISIEGQNKPAIKFVNCTNITVKDLTIIGDTGGPNYNADIEADTYTNRIGIFMSYVYGNNLIKNVHFLNHGLAGIKTWGNTNNLIIDSCSFKAPDVHIVYGDRFCCGLYDYFPNESYSASDWTVRNCYFDTLAIPVLTWSRHDYMEFYHNTITNVIGQHGFYLEDNSHVYIADNKITNVAMASIKLQFPAGVEENQTDIVISRNIIINNENHLYSENQPRYNNSPVNQDGILIATSLNEYGAPANGSIRWNNVTIEDNIITNCDYGIYLRTVDGATVNRNIITNLATNVMSYGIMALDCESIILTNNTINSTEKTSQTNSGFYIKDVNNINIEHNTIDKWRNGIYTYAVLNAHINYNQIINGDKGISIYYGISGEITHNYIITMEYDAIYCDSLGVNALDVSYNTFEDTNHYNGAADYNYDTVVFFNNTGSSMGYLNYDNNAQIKTVNSHPRFGLVVYSQYYITTTWANNIIITGWAGSYNFNGGANTNGGGNTYV